VNAELEAEFRALETVLGYSEGGLLTWPDAEQDIDAFRDCARAASRLGWLGNDGAPEPPPPVGDVDSFLLAYGGWLGPDTADVAAIQLAATIVATEAETRAAGFEALAVVLDHVEDGIMRWPDEAVDRANLFKALESLGWVPGPPVDGANGEGS
jgi:hypothetical protein